MVQNGQTEQQIEGDRRDDEEIDRGDLVAPNLGAAHSAFSFFDPERVRE